MNEFSPFPSYYVPGVKPLCRKILQVWGKSETNFDVLYKIGHARIRLGDYKDAAAHFAVAHRIDSTQALLRLSMRELQRKIIMDSRWRRNWESNEGGMRRISRP